MSTEMRHFGWVLLLCLARLPTSGVIADRTSLSEPVLLDFSFEQASARSPVQGFFAYGGAWQVQEKEGVVHVEAGPGPKLIYDHLPFRTGKVGVEMLLPDEGPGNAGLIVKVSQPGVGADRFNGYEIALDASAQILRLGRHRQNFELIRDVPCPVPVHEWIPVVVQMTDATLEVSVAGRTVVRYEDTTAPLKAGTIGLRPWQREARYRNLWIESGGAAEQIAFVDATQKESEEIYPGWTALQRGTAQPRFRLVVDRAGSHRPSQRLTCVKGVGEVGLAHSGRDGSGLPFVSGSRYVGFVWAQSDTPLTLFAAAEDAAGTVLAETGLKVPPGGWQHLGFSLTPGQSRPVRSGRFVLKLRSPGSVQLARVHLEGGDWAWPESLAFGQLPPILFLKRQMLSGPPVVGCDLWAARPTGPGCAICLWNPSHPDRPIQTVFADATGCIYDLNLSLNGKTVFFSYQGEGEKYWHLWQIGVDGSGLRQITQGPFYDVGPCELPDGDLIFVSTRRFGHTVCQPGPASNLYRVSPAGGPPRCMSMNSLSDTTPQLLPDGRVLFMRWEYVDRDLTYRQSLWTQNPDGTGYQLYFGNTIRDPGTFWQARPVPGRSDRVLATFAPHHGYPHGAIGWIERNHGPETARGIGFNWITQEFPTIGDHSFKWSYRDPLPLNEESFLCAYGGGAERFRVFLHDVNDQKRLLYDDPQWHCFFPLALSPTKAPRLAPRIPIPSNIPPDLPEDHPPEAQPMGACLLIDVYQGLGPAIAQGQVKSIRIMEQIRKTEDIPVIPHVVDFGPRAYDQSPLMSYGTYYAKRCWGTVPVEPDGSAYFKVPALREIYFQACDAEGRELQRMTSGAQIMPGETTGCVGCHEHRTTTPVPSGRLPLAAQRAPSAPQKPDWAPDGVIDFVSVVQPVLDRYCVECHSGGNPDGGYDLSGDKTRFFNMAYDNLLGRSQSYRQHNMETGEMLPEEVAKGKPLVHFYWLLRTPTAVNRPLWAGSHASRLPAFIETDHCGQPLPLEDRKRIYTWIDADVPYYGTYATSRRKCGGKRDLCQIPQTAEPAPWFTDGFMSVYRKRCASCHGDYPQTRLITCWDGRTAWINFTHPEFSPALTAHLPETMGGRGITQTPEGEAIPMFTGPADPDYQAMRHAIQVGKTLAEQHPGPDMAGYTGRAREP